MRAHRIATAIACLGSLLAVAPQADAASLRDRLKIDVQLEGRVTERWNRSLTIPSGCHRRTEAGGTADIRFSLPRTRMIFSFKDVELRGRAIADMSVDRTGYSRNFNTNLSGFLCQEHRQELPAECGHRELKSPVTFDQAGGFRFGVGEFDEPRIWDHKCPYPDPINISGFVGTTGLLAPAENGSRARWIRKQFGFCNRARRCHNGHRNVTVHHRKRIAIPYEGEFGDTGTYEVDFEWTAKTRRVAKLPRQRS